MTALPRSGHLLLLLLAATLATPLAAAEEGQVQAEAAVYRGGARLHGDAVAFFLVDHVEDPDAAPVGGGSAPAAGDPLLGIELDARALEAFVFESHHLVTAGDAAMQADPRHPPQPPARHLLEGVKGALVSQQADFQVNLLPVEATGTVPFRASSGAGRLDPMDALAMGPGRFHEATPADQDLRDPGSPEFWQVRVDQPLVALDDQAAALDVTFTGSMVLEIVGAAVQLDGKGGSLLLDSGVWRDPSAGTGLPLDQPAVVAQRTVFARVVLTDAKVRLTVQGGAPGLHLAAPDLSTEHDGEATLLGVHGDLSVGNATLRLDGGRHVLPAGHDLAVGRGPTMLALGVAPSAATAAPGAGGTLARTGPSAAVAAVAVLALLAAAGLGLARRLTSAPDLRDVEAALEGQRFGRAARLAKRILRARPGSEDAMLGRAIALSKAGRATAAIAEIREHLAARDPSDGALHYVLGLALLDAGRGPEAHTALAEAVRRTPSLQADVAARLGQQASSAPWPTAVREAHGYA